MLMEREWISALKLDLNVYSILNEKQIILITMCKASIRVVKMQCRDLIRRASTLCLKVKI